MRSLAVNIQHILHDAVVQRNNDPVLDILCRMVTIGWSMSEYVLLDKNSYNSSYVSSSMTSSHNTAIMGNSQQLYNVHACDVHLCSLIWTKTLPCHMSKLPCSLNFSVLQRCNHRSWAASHCRDAYCRGGRLCRGGNSNSITPTMETLS